MSDLVSPSSENAFAMLRSDLDSLMKELSSWAALVSEQESLGRVRRSLSDLVARHVRVYVDVVSEVRNQIPATDFEGVRSRVADLRARLNLDDLSTLVDCRFVIEWIQQDLVKVLDWDPWADRVKLTSSQSAEYSALFQARRSLGYEYAAEKRAASLERLLNEYDASNRNLDDSFDTLAVLQARIREEIKTSSDLRDRTNDDFEKIAEASKSALAAQGKLERQTKRWEALNKNASENKLIASFKTFTEKHGSSYGWFLASGLFMAICVGFFAVLHTYDFSTRTFIQQSSFASISWKVAVLAAGTTIATFLLRQASYHRQLSVWGDTVQVQLQTIEPYIDQVSDEASKSQLRLEFARRVFGQEPSATKGQQENPMSPVSVPEITALITSLMKLQEKPKP